MPSGSVASTISVAGILVTSRCNRSASGQIGHEVPLPAGKNGTLSTRTDDDTGVATLDSDHGITISDTVDVFWDGGVRYGMGVTIVDGNDVTLDLGAGDVLPSQGAVVIVTPRVEIDTDFDGDLLKMIAVHADRRAHVEFLTAAPASLKAMELTAGEAWAWVSEQGVANPLAGNPVDTMQVSVGVAEAGTMKIGVLYDSA